MEVNERDLELVLDPRTPAAPSSELRPIGLRPIELRPI